MFAPDPIALRTSSCPRTIARARACRAARSDWPILGATGSLGRRLRRQGVAAGHAVTLSVLTPVVFHKSALTPAPAARNGSGSTRAFGRKRGRRRGIRHPLHRLRHHNGVAVEGCRSKTSWRRRALPTDARARTRASARRRPSHPARRVGECERKLTRYPILATSRAAISTSSSSHNEYIRLKCPNCTSVSEVITVTTAIGVEWPFSVRAFDKSAASISGIRRRRARRPTERFHLQQRRRYRGGDDVIALEAQHARKRLANVRVVVDDEHLIH